MKRMCLNEMYRMWAGFHKFMRVFRIIYTLTDKCFLFLRFFIKIKQQEVVPRWNENP